MHAKPDNDSDRQRPIARGLPHGRPQWACRVCRSSASYEGLVLPPPRLARLGSMIPLGRHTSHRLTPPPNPHFDHSLPAAPPVLQTTAPDHDANARAGDLSNMLLSHRDWEQAQRVDPLCDVTCRYTRLDRPTLLPPLSLRTLALTHAA